MTPEFVVAFAQDAIKTTILVSLSGRDPDP